MNSEAAPTALAVPWYWIGIPVGALVLVPFLATMWPIATVIVPLVVALVAVVSFVYRRRAPAPAQQSTRAWMAVAWYMVFVITLIAHAYASIEAWSVDVGLWVSAAGALLAVSAAAAMQKLA